GPAGGSPRLRSPGRGGVTRRRRRRRYSCFRLVELPPPTCSPDSSLISSSTSSISGCSSLVSSLSVFFSGILPPVESSPPSGLPTPAYDRPPRVVYGLGDKR